MTFWWTVLTVGLGLCVLILGARLLVLRCSIREVAEGLEEKLRTDTNTLLGISSGDRALRALADRINAQLRALRRQLLRGQTRDAELKPAVTNIPPHLPPPLTARGGYLDLLEPEPHTERSRQYLSVIRERTDTMRAMTEELFRYSVIASTAEELTLGPVCLNDILEESLAGLYGLFSARGIQPEITLPEEKVTRRLDAAALRRVFDNILNNAAKYSDGDLEITLRPDGTLTFVNSADKLDRVQAQRLFDRFFTVETAEHSTGLGLSIARLLTEKMGGNIAAEYEEGKLRIRVVFPR